MGKDWLSGLFGGLGSVIGSGINAISQANTNKANVAIANATNRANANINASNIAAAYNMQDRANEFNREQFAAANSEWQRRYNQETDVSAQRKRIEAAGLNPYTMLGNTSLGSASTGSPAAQSSAQGQVPSSIPMQAAQKKAVQFYDTRNIIQDIGSAIMLKDTMRKNKAEADSAESGAEIAKQDAAIRSEYNQMLVNRMMKESGLFESRMRGQDIQNSWSQQTLDARVHRAQLDNDYLDQEIGYMKLQAATLDAQLPYVGRKAYYEMQEAFMRWRNSFETRKLLRAQTNESYQRAKESAENVLRIAAEKAGLHLSQQQSRRMFPLLLHNTWEEGKILDETRWNANYNNWLIRTDVSDMSWSQFLEYASRNWNSPVHGNFLLNTGNGKKAPKPVKGFK